MAIFHGLSAIPFEHQDAAPTEALRHISHQRAAAARVILDLLHRTTPPGTLARSARPNQTGH
jgi:hypothetical protein